VEVEKRLLDEALTRGAVALDAGCGRTTRLRNFRDRISRLVGVDVDEAAGRENPYLDEFAFADLADPLPFDDAVFDLVYANFVVEHLEEPEGTFTEWRRVLQPKGRLVLLTTNRASPLMLAADRTPERGVATSNRTVRLAALLQVTLMIFLRAPEFRCRLDLRHDWTIETAAFFHFSFRSSRRRFLLG